jgi:hypothetical protein
MPFLSKILAVFRSDVSISPGSARSIHSGLSKLPFLVHHRVQREKMTNARLFASFKPTYVRWAEMARSW